MDIQQVTIPRYLTIAVNLSSRIASGEIPEDEKLKGRSVLSTEYNVSPETIRRAMSILSDKKVVRVVPGKGIIVFSRKNALQFLESFKTNETITDLRKQLSIKFEEKKKIDENIIDLVNRIIQSSTDRRSDLIKPIDIVIPENSHVIGKSIGELQIWHNTGATIIGIIQDNKVVISPGPYYEFHQNERVLIVGDANVINRFNSYVSRAEEKL